jgi:hypothetical protein
MVPDGRHSNAWPSDCSRTDTVRCATAAIVPSTLATPILTSSAPSVVDPQEPEQTRRTCLTPTRWCRKELAHVDLHSPGQAGSTLPRAVKEVEAESVAWLLADHAGIDAAGYSFAYLAPGRAVTSNW